MKVIHETRAAFLAAFPKHLQVGSLDAFLDGLRRIRAAVRESVVAEVAENDGRPNADAGDVFAQHLEAVLDKAIEEIKDTRRQAIRRRG
jgi:hypothetical protein